MLMSAPRSASPLTIFGADLASRLSTMIVGWSPFALSLMKGMSDSAPDIRFLLIDLIKGKVINSRGLQS